jgi:GDP-D-mannose dehydratase
VGSRERLSDLSISSVSGGVPNRDAAEAVGIDNLKSAASENGASPEPQGFRPTEVDLLIGDASKARSKLGWQHRVSFDELVAEMVAGRFQNGSRREITCPHPRRLMQDRR